MRLKTSNVHDHACVRVCVCERRSMVQAWNSWQDLLQLAADNERVADEFRRPRELALMRAVLGDWCTWADRRGRKLEGRRSYFRAVLGAKQRRMLKVGLWVVERDWGLGLESGHRPALRFHRAGLWHLSPVPSETGSGRGELRGGPSQLSPLESFQLTLLTPACSV